MFDALLFDLDGTLIDTESLAIAAGLAAFAELGHLLYAAGHSRLHPVRPVEQVRH